MWPHFWSQTMLLAMLNILTYLRGIYLRVILCYLFFPFKNCSLAPRRDIFLFHYNYKDASYFTESKDVKIMRFECQNPKLWQFENLKLLSSATWSSNFKTNTLVEISKTFSTWILNFIVFEEQKNFNPQPTQFLKNFMNNY